MIVKNGKYWLATLLLCMVSCSDGEKADDHHPHDEETSISHTIWTERTELFVEFKPLVVGEVTAFAAHFTNISDFKPVVDGSVTVSLVRGKEGIRSTVDAPSSPGIFRPTIEPTAAGTYELWFDISTPEYTDHIVIPGVQVYENAEKAQQSETAHAPDDGISFLKEQAWKIDWEVQPVRREAVSDMIHTTGRILPAKGDENLITATTDGIVVFRKSDLVPGSPVRAGELLFVISGGGLTSSNVETQFLEAKSNYTNRKQAFERKEQLFQLGSITKSEYEEAKLAYELALTEYTNLADNFSESGKRVVAEHSGYIKDVPVTEGGFVSLGQPLAVVTQSRRFVMEADLPLSHLDQAPNIWSANFRLSGSDRVHSLAEHNGGVLSYGKTVTEGSPVIPILFNLDNTGSLLSGIPVEVFLLTRKSVPALVIPKEALMESTGTYYVYVQRSGEDFIRRDVQLGVDDGRMVEVTSGLREGEMVVTKGAYQVKMASMSSSVPAHGHSH